MSRYAERNIDIQILQLLQSTTRYFSEQQQRPYLVGGSLRNLLLGEECLDWDIVTQGDAHNIARQIANKLGGHSVHMHEKASRVIVIVEDTGSPQIRKEICFDISPLIGKTIEEDLRQRDFTINAIAAPLDEVVHYLENNPSTSVGAREVEQGGVGRYDRLPWFALRRRLSMNKQYTHPRATITAHPTSTQPPSPLQYDQALHFIDPLNGLIDLQARRLKAVNDTIFLHDPLRMLRAVRLIMRYQLDIDPWTASLLKRDAVLLPEVASERVHDELYAILGPQGAAKRLRFLDEHGLFTVIFPEFVPARGMCQPYPHYWDVLTHSIESVAALEHISQLVQMHSHQTVGATFTVTQSGAGEAETNINLAEISILLQEAEQQGIFSLASLSSSRMKMAALLHDIGKPLTYSCDEEGAIHFYNHPLAGVPLVEQIMRRLCASTQNRRLAQLVAAHHMRPGQLGQDGPVTPRAIRRYFVDLGPTGISVALFSLADHLATLGPQPTDGAWQRHLEIVRQLLTSYIRERDSILPPRLISPEELIRRLKLKPGPIVGQLLDMISEAQAEGTIHSKEEAIWFAEEHLHV